MFLFDLCILKLFFRIRVSCIAVGNQHGMLTVSETSLEVFCIDNKTPFKLKKCISLENNWHIVCDCFYYNIGPMQCNKVLRRDAYYFKNISKCIFVLYPRSIQAKQMNIHIMHKKRMELVIKMNFLLFSEHSLNLVTILNINLVDKKPYTISN